MVRVRDQLPKQWKFYRALDSTRLQGTTCTGYICGTRKQFLSKGPPRAIYFILWVALGTKRDTKSPITKANCARINMVVRRATSLCAVPPAFIYIKYIYLLFFLQRSESEVARAHGAAYQVISPISCMLNKFMTLIVRSLFFVRWEKCTYTTFSFGASEEEKSCGSLYNASQTRKSHIAQVCV